MPTFGYILLLLGLVLATYAACSAVLGHHLRNPRLALSSQFATYGVFGVLTCSSAVLTYLFLANDYSVKYVEHYSDRSMSLFYKATAFWGGRMARCCSGSGCSRFGGPSRSTRTVTETRRSCPTASSP